MSDLLSTFFGKLIDGVAKSTQATLQRAEHRKDLGAFVAWKKENQPTSSVQIQQTHGSADHDCLVVKKEKQEYRVANEREADKIVSELLV